MKQAVMKEREEAAEAVLKNNIPAQSKSGGRHEKRDSYETIGMLQLKLGKPLDELNKKH